MNSLEVAYEFKKVSKQLYGRESAVDVTRLTVSGALYAHNKKYSTKRSLARINELLHRLTSYTYRHRIG